MEVFNTVLEFVICIFFAHLFSIQSFFVKSMSKKKLKIRSVSLFLQKFRQITTMHGGLFIEKENFAEKNSPRRWEKAKL